MKPNLLSRREKLLLGLLTSTLIFSASFSYAAVNTNKVDAIMKMITDGGAKFSDIPVSGQTKSERTSYYEKVDAGLGDAVEMLAVVRNNLRSLMGLSPAYSADDVVGSILGGILGGTTGGNTGTSGNSNSTIDPRMGSCKTTAYAGSYAAQSVIDCTQPYKDTGSDYGSAVALQCSISNNNAPGSIGYGATGIKPIAKGNGNFVIEYKPGMGAPLSGIYDGAKYWRFSINAEVEGGEKTRIAKLEVAISSQPNDFTSSNVIQKGTTLGRTDQGLVVYDRFDPILVMPRDYPQKLYINVRPVTYYDMTKGTSYTDAEITEVEARSRGLSLPNISFYLIPYYIQANPPSGNGDLAYMNSAKANSCFAQASSSSSNNNSTSSAWSSPTSISCPTSTGALQSANPSTVSSTNSTGFHYTSVGGVYFNVKNYANATDISLPTSCTAGQKWIAKSGTNSCSVYSCGAGTSTANPPASSDLGIFANDPIPPPCPANTKLMNEVLGSNHIYWLKRPIGINKEKDHHVYRLRIDTPSTKDTLGVIAFGTSDLGSSLASLSISPYPCFFVDDPSVTTTNTPSQTIDGASAYCYHESSQGGSFTYSMEGSPENSNAKCKLKPGVTYYMNIAVTGNGYGATNGYNSDQYELQTHGLDVSPDRLLYGVYKSYEDYLPYRLSPNIASQSAESLRQKVINDYKTIGKNSDKPNISGTYIGSTIANSWDPNTKYVGKSCTLNAINPTYATVNTTLVYKSAGASDSSSLAHCDTAVDGGVSNITGKSRTDFTFSPSYVACKNYTTGIAFKLDYDPECYTFCRQKTRNEGYIDVRGDCTISTYGGHFE